MVIGYFLYELMIYGLPGALLEFFLNGIIQFGLGAIIALIFAFSARESIVDNLPNVFTKIYIPELQETNSKES